MVLLARLRTIEGTTKLGMLRDGGKMKKSVLAIVTAFMLVGCGSLTTTDGGSDATAPTYDQATNKIGMVDSIGITESQQIIQSASVTLRVDDVSDSANQIVSYVESIGGRIDSRNEYRDPASSEITSADLMIKVPADQLDSALEQLKTFGNLEGFSKSAGDVTLQVIDLDARIASLEESIANLRKLLADATSVTDLLAAETALSDRQAELDSLKSQRTYLADQIELSAIWVNLVPKRALDAVEPIGFIAGLETGWNAIVDFAGNLTTWAGLALPWFGLLIALLIIFKIIAAIRRSSRIG